MKIETVKQTQSGFLVNGTLHVPNDSLNPDFREVQSWIDEGGEITPEFTDEEILGAAKEERISSRLLYLSSTDWMAAAFVKYGRQIEDGIKEKCQLARDEINAIEACLTLEELNAININFE